MNNTSSNNVAIFNSIVNISTSMEFAQKQQEYYHHQMNIFSEEEHNSFE